MPKDLNKLSMWAFTTASRNSDSALFAPSKINTSFCHRISIAFPSSCYLCKSLSFTSYFNIVRFVVGLSNCIRPNAIVMIVANRIIKSFYAVAFARGFAHIIQKPNECMPLVTDYNSYRTISWVLVILRVVTAGHHICIAVICSGFSKSVSLIAANITWLKWSFFIKHSDIFGSNMSARDFSVSIKIGWGLSSMLSAFARTKYFSPFGAIVTDNRREFFNYGKQAKFIAIFYYKFTHFDSLIKGHLKDARQRLMRSFSGGHPSLAKGNYTMRLA